MITSERAHSRCRYSLEIFICFRFAVFLHRVSFAIERKSVRCSDEFYQPEHDLVTLSSFTIILLSLCCLHWPSRICVVITYDCAGTADAHYIRPKIRQKEKQTKKREANARSRARVKFLSCSLSFSNQIIRQMINCY